MKSNVVIFLLMVLIVGLSVYGIRLMAGMSTDQFDQKFVKPYENKSQTELPIGSVTVDGLENNPVQSWFEWETESEGLATEQKGSQQTTIDLQVGLKHYQDFCQVCHGSGVKRNNWGLATSKINEVGMVATDLPSLTPFRDDRFLYLKIVNGGTVMPRMGHIVITENRWQIIAYLRSVEMAP